MSCLFHSFITKPNKKTSNTRSQCMMKCVCAQRGGLFSCESGLIKSKYHVTSSPDIGHTHTHTTTLILSQDKCEMSAKSDFTTKCIRLYIMFYLTALQSALLNLALLCTRLYQNLRHFHFIFRSDLPRTTYRLAFYTTRHRPSVRLYVSHNTTEALLSK